jgi:hypothetical protein
MCERSGGDSSCAVVDGWRGYYGHIEIEPMKKLGQVDRSSHECPFVRKKTVSG